jgi:hypothetical protein
MEVTAFPPEVCKTALRARFIQDRGSEWINACGIEVQLPGNTLPAVFSHDHPR